MKINEIETKRPKKRTKKKSMKPRAFFFLENVKKTDKPEATLTRETEFR